MTIHALSDIGSTQAKPTKTTTNKTTQFLDYMHMHPNAKIRFYTLDMTLNVHSDALYLSVSKGHSQEAGHFSLGSIPIGGQPIKLNGPIYTLYTILKLVAASAAKAKLGTLFLNTQLAKIIRITLIELGHP